MSTVRFASSSLGYAVASAYRTFVDRVRLRISQARGTERVEITLGVFGLFNAVWSFSGQSEYTQGWRVAGMVLTQHEAGLAIVFLNVLRWSSVYEGGVRSRRFVTQLCTGWGVAMLTLVFLGNPHNPTLPWLLAGVVVNIGVNGALAKHEERGGAP